MTSNWLHLVVGCLLSILLCGCDRERPEPVFTLITSEASGLTFSNDVETDETYNILDFEFVYNGGGVAIADFDGDGLEDIYFTGNTVSNQLYLNRGNLKFEDATLASGAGAADRWCSGVTAGDVNGDGRMDLYVSATVYPRAELRANLLFINQGNDADGIPQFIDEAAAYGLADTSHTTQAAFFDYDRDGDLDLYVVVNEMDDRLIPNRYVKKVRDGSGRRNDRLYRNEGLGPSGHPTFTDVTAKAGINMDGYGLGISICDLNDDGWPDVYVTNDYVTNDLLWINNGDGTFTDQADRYFKHSAYSAMGNDVADLNNDGEADVIALDMFPETNFRRKTMMPPNNYMAYLNNERYGYLPQFTRNVLQLNAGMTPDGTPTFAEIGGLSGVAATDWSWSVLAADYDLDGDRDLLISNGFPKDVTDHDFMDYNVTVGNIASRDMLIEQIPTVKIQNFAFENDGDAVPRFTKVNETWGMTTPSYSNGAAYTDLDGDGDLDYVVNNIDDACFLYRNNTIEQAGDGVPRHITFQLNQPGLNPTAIGAKLTLYDSEGSLIQSAFQNPVRGYLSSVSHQLSFALPGPGAYAVHVRWPDGSTRQYQVPQENGAHTLHKSQGEVIAAPKTTPGQYVLQSDPSWLSALSPHRDSLFIDFNVQPLLPHKLSEAGPGLAVGDVNGDGLDDLYRAGSHFYRGELLLQTADGQLKPSTGVNVDTGPEELGCLFFDADNDGDTDLYLASGGSELSRDSDDYLDRLLLNDGGGNFTLAASALPAAKISSSCVRAADVDKDGDLDLFIGGRLAPARYPEPVSSQLLINDGAGRFTESPTSPFKDFGLVTDALFTDYDNDSWVDLIVVGQGSACRVFHNEAGAFKEVSQTGLEAYVGWWNGISGADFDRDGDIDYVVTNYGGNHLYHANGEDFVGMYGADFDGNGGFDLILSSRTPGQDGRLTEFPHFGRRDMEKQIIAVKDKYPLHKTFAQATMDQMLADFPSEGLVALKANYLRSAYVENLGGGRFSLTALPRAAQVAPMYGSVVSDVDGDGYPDVMLAGNDYGAETGGGTLSASNGIYLRYDPAAKRFSPIPLSESGLFVPGNARSAVQINKGDQRMVVFAQNRGAEKTYQLPANQLKPYRVQPLTTRVVIELADGSSVIRECYYGSGYLSQSSRTVWIPENAVAVSEK